MTEPKAYGWVWEIKDHKDRSPEGEGESVPKSATCWRCNTIIPIRDPRG